MIVEVEAASDGDFRTGGQEHLVIGALFCGQEIAAVAQGRDQGAEDIGDRARDGVAFRSGLGSGSSWKGRQP